MEWSALMTPGALAAAGAGDFLQPDPSPWKLYCHSDDRVLALLEKLDEAYCVLTVQTRATEFSGKMVRIRFGPFAGEVILNETDPPGAFSGRWQIPASFGALQQWQPIFEIADAKNQ